MYKIHEFTYIPILIGAKKRYILELEDLHKTPVIFKTMTTDMKSIFGEIKSIYNNGKGIFAYVDIRQGTVEARVVGPVSPSHPCWVTEHLTLDGHMELVVSSKQILQGNINFINFGIPMHKYIKIDIYTGESRLINV